MQYRGKCKMTGEKIKENFQMNSKLTFSCIDSAMVI